MKPPAGTQIDFTHPLASRIIGYFNGADGVRWTNGPASDKNTTLEIEAGHSTQVFSAGPLGRSILPDFTTDDFDNRGFTFVNGANCPVGPSGAGITVVMAFNETQSVGTTQNLLISLGSELEGIYSGKPGQTAGELGWQFASGIRGPASIGMDFTSPGPKIIAASTKNNATNGGAAWYRDGVLLNSGAELANWTTDEVLAGLLSNGDFGLGKTNQDLAFCLVLEGTALDGQISHQAIESLTVNPWQIFKPKRLVGISRVTEEVKFNVIEKPWTKQPPAGTKANPKWLARGLNWLWHGNNPHHEVVGDTPHDSGNTVDADLAIASEGQVIRGTGQSRDTMVLSFPSPLGQAGKGQQQVTVGTYFKLLNLNDTVQTYLWSARQVTPSTAGWFIRKREDPSQGGNGNLEFFIDGAGGAGVGNWTLYNDLINFNTFTGTFDGVECWGYLNGVPGGQFFAGDPGDVIEDHAAAVVIGGQDSPLNSVESASDLALLYVFHTKLTQAEIKFLSENPWDLFEPELIHVPFNEELPKLATFDDPKPVTSMPARPPK